MTERPTERPTETLLSMLEPIAAKVAELGPASATDDASASKLAAALDEAIPFDGDDVRAIGTEIRRGIAEGWLCDRGEPEARFCRVAKPGPQTSSMSVDVVSLVGPALRHTHPQGEVTMAFPADLTEDADEAGRFDGHPPGWVVMPAGSTHTPTVTGPRMHLLYFLPDGAVEWHPG